MLLVRINPGEDYIIEDDSIFNDSTFRLKDIPPEKVHRVFHRIIELSEEEMIKYFGENYKEQPNVTKSQVEFSFQPLSQMPFNFKRFFINMNNIIFYGELTEDCGLLMLFNKYKAEMNL